MKQKEKKIIPQAFTSRIVTSEDEETDTNNNKGLPLSAPAPLYPWCELPSLAPLGVPSVNHGALKGSYFSPKNPFAAYTINLVPHGGGRSWIPAPLPDLAPLRKAEVREGLVPLALFILY